MSTGRKPNFLIIGAPKSGTTTLARYLGAHPEVYMAPEKELRYFDGRDHLGSAWYLDFFRSVKDELAVGEATPTYMVHPEAPRRMAELLPDARLIAILRNPVDRAYSHYWQVRRRGAEPREFSEAVREEEPQALHPAGGQARAYVGIGHYIDQLRNVGEHFPREAIMVVILEDMVDDPAATLAEVHRFLGVDDAFTPANLGHVYNASHSLRSWRIRRTMLRLRAWSLAPGLARRLERLNRAEADYPEMEAGVRRDLLKHYAPANQDLADWLGRDLARWSA